MYIHLVVRLDLPTTDTFRCDTRRMNFVPSRFPFGDDQSRLPTLLDLTPAE